MKVLLCWLSLLGSLLVSPLAAEERVNFYAWGGSDAVNRYLEWASAELAEQHGIRLQHVKVADISEAVALILATEDSTPIDLLWVNGENFHILKQQNKLLGDLPQKVANSALIRRDLQWQYDFGVAVDGYELPWGMAQFQLLLAAEVGAEQTDDNAQQQVSPAALLALAQRYPGRLSYPKPPSFHGTSWLKTLAYHLSEQPQLLQQAPATVEVEQVLAPLWAYLDQLHPYLWRAGDEFPTSAERQRLLFNQGVLLNSVSFNPSEVPALQQQGKLRPDAQAASLGAAALSNFHYLAIPAQSERQQAALKVINFFLSPEAQSQKAALDVWGDPPVVETADAATAVIFPAHPEPHVAWTELLEAQWLARYQR